MENRKNNLPMQTEDFCDLELEDGSILTEKERERASKLLPEIVLPKEGKLISEFAEEVADIIKEKKTIFYRSSSKEILEIGLIKEKNTENEYLGFSHVKPERFITISEKYFIPSVENYTKMGIILKAKSMSGVVANILLNSPQLQEALPKIDRIFKSPIPIIHKGKLTFPKKGYDERFKSFTPYNVPNLRIDMTLEEAKELIHKVYGEFCFQERQDYINAIAGLLTPYLRGLFPKFSERTPLKVYIANRERAGKDYLAGITGLVHEGYALEEPPISNGEHGGSNSEELRKKITSGLMAGRTSFHFSNNKGRINNPVLEGFITTAKWSDRILGRNEMITLDNEMDISLSGNVGIGFTPDLINRSKFIRLFLDIEDANSRKFENPNLHKWVMENRGEILSALYAFVRNWFEKGCPDGSVPFTSFPEWARICGGIMECAGYESPCTTDKEVLAIGGDSETDDMRSLFELCYEKYSDKWINKNEIRLLITDNEDGLFSYFDFNKRTDLIKFGLKITKFIGRILSDITLKIKDRSVRASRQEYMFTKDKIEKDKSKIFGIVGRVGIDSHSKANRLDEYKGVAETIPSIPSLPKEEKKPKFTDKEIELTGLDKKELRKIEEDFSE